VKQCSAFMTVPVEEYVRQALVELGADRRLVAGAAVGAKAGAIARRDGVDLSAVLKSRGSSLGRLLETSASKLGTKIVRREGTDFLVGFDSAIGAPPVPEPVQLRHDVYQAFSRDRGGYYYDSISDEFTMEARPTAVIVSPLTYDQAVAFRNDFALSLGAEGEVLRATLEPKDQALTAFGNVLRTSHLTQQWRFYISSRLKEHVLNWAASSGVEVKASWFEPSIPTRRPSSATSDRRALLDVLGSLTEQEADQILIPLSIVERLIRRKA
jgi:hypothetical protein